MLEKFKRLRPSRPYILLLITFGALYAWRMSGIYWIAPISGHLSNFALTGILLLLLIGPLHFERKEARSRVLALSIFFILANIIVESLNIGSLFTPTAFNTADLLDAMFGIIAAALVVSVYWARQGRS